MSKSIGQKSKWQCKYIVQIVNAMPTKYVRRNGGVVNGSCQRKDEDEEHESKGRLRRKNNMCKSNRTLA